MYIKIDWLALLRNIRKKNVLKNRLDSFIILLWKNVRKNNNEFQTNRKVLKGTPKNTKCTPKKERYS